ncbi:MAG: hypothetical protein Fur0022_28700 [Anaerolineales bacterium]
MKRFLLRHTHLLSFFLFLFLAACTQPTPTQSLLPVPNVPPIDEVDRAISLWESGNNTRYTVTIEETNNTGTFLYRVVIADGKVRAAQQQAKVDGAWQTPIALPLETAEQYKIDALLQRVRNDVLGLGVVPMDMQVIFDPTSGYPSVVEANALPTYSPEGNLQLNRDLGYSLTTHVEVLIEDTVSTTKDSLLYLTRSGGEQAYCDTLRILADGSSIYTDDCREVLLQLTLPTAKYERLLELSASLSTLNETKEEMGAKYDLTLYGTGTQTAEATTLDQVWTLSQELADLLSHPIGAGVTLLYANQNQLFGFDMRSSMGQPANLQLTPPLYGMASNLDGSLLAYADGESLHWVDLLTGETGTFFSNLSDGHYRPRGWNEQGQLLLQRFSTPTSAPEWGWTSRDDPTWQPIDFEEGLFACDTGVSLNPKGGEFVIAVGGACENDLGLTLVNIADGTVRKLIDAQSVPGSGTFHPAWSPDGSWIAFSLELRDSSENPQQIFLVRADGSEMLPLTRHTTGQASHPIWSTEGTQIFYALHGAETGEDGIYTYTLSSGQVALTLAGENIFPVSISPEDEFMIFSTETEMRAFLFSHGDVYPIVRWAENEPVVFVGWLDERSDK